MNSTGLKDLSGSIPAEIQLIVDYFSNPFTHSSLELPRGICLVGRPGMGKTRLAKALAEELGKHAFMYCTAREFTQNSQWYIRNGRWQAQNNQAKKAVLFVDDFSFTNNQTDPTLTDLFDGFDSDESIIVIIACHTDGASEKPFVRSGRFDTVIELSVPSLSERLKYLTELNANSAIKNDSSVDLQKIASLCYNFTYADLKKLYSQAQLHAHQETVQQISFKHYLESIVDVLKNQERLDKSLNIRIKVILDLAHKNKTRKKGFDRLVAAVPDEIKELVEQIKDSKKFKQFNLTIPKGILLSGPPGTGKTTLVRALSEEAGCEFMAVSASEFIDKWVGEGGQKIRDAFKEARQKAQLSQSGKTILFLDEIDVLGKRQGSVLDSTVTELLTQMDGFEEDDSVIVIGATNHPESIDAALLRPGRFNKIIKVELPDLAKRKLLLDHYTQGIPLSQAVDKNKIAQAAHNYSPADIKELVQKAGSLALKDNVQEIQEKHFIDAMKKMLHERKIKGEKDVESQLNALDVVFNGKTTNKGFKRLVGDVDQNIKDLTDMLSGSVDYAHFGLPFPKGILLVGPPGTGKTMLARAIAEESGCEFIQAKGSDFVEKYVGVGAQRVRELFDKARTKAQGNSKGKTIIFIDELDAIGSRNTSNDGAGEETKRTVTEFLTQMDGFYKDDSVIILAATNIPNALDPALTRAGRFDTIIEIPLPDINKREALFKHYAQNRPLGNDVDFKKLAQSTKHCNAADIKNIVDKAAQHAMRLRAQHVYQGHFDLAVLDIQAAQDKKKRSFTINF